MLRPMKTLAFTLLSLAACMASKAAVIAPEVAELSFDSRWAGGSIPQDVTLPSWITQIQQSGGFFSDEPRCWSVDAAAPKGAGKIEITLDRARVLSGNLVVTLLFDADENADMAAQLFDSQGRVVVVDLFGNIVDIGRQATTDTFVVPLSKYPSADRLVIRRVQGGLRLHGLVLFPIVAEGPMEEASLKDLARTLGDPLSPENPLVPRIQNLARTSRVPVSPVKPVSITTAASQTAYPAATPPSTTLPAPTDGLLVQMNFDQGNTQDSSGLGNHGQLQVGATLVPTAERGNVLRLRKKDKGLRSASWDSVIIPSDKMPKLHDDLSLCAWVRYRSISPGFGSQIVWHGDSKPGRDPWVLHLLPSGRAEFRSDRSVTGRPEFTVFKNEISLTPAGKALPTQQVKIKSPQKLAPDQWYFVVGTMEMMNARTRTMRLYVNGDRVSELQTTEGVDYDTAGMWTTIGAVDRGGWQVLDGDIDDVRIYERALQPAEVKALYSQPWK